MSQKSAQLDPFCPCHSLPRHISVHLLFRFKYLHVQVAVLKCLPYWTLAVLGINQPPSPHYHAGRVVFMGAEIQSVTIWFQLNRGENFH